MKMSKILATIVALGLIGGVGYNLTQERTNQIVSESNKVQGEIAPETEVAQVSETNETNEEASEDTNLVADNVAVEGSEPTQTEDNAEVAISTETKEQAAVVESKLAAANTAFVADGMNDVYAKLRSSQKKKWLKQINENDYFDDDSLQYQISSIYELGDNQYYILGWSAPSDGKLALAEKWSESQRESYPAQDIFELVLREENGNYFVTQAIYPSEQVLTSDEVALYKKEEQAESNVAIEYKKVRNFEGVDEYVNYLDEAINELKGENITSGNNASSNNENAADLNVAPINDAGKSEVTQYVQYAIEDLSSTSTVAEDNTIDVKAELLTQMKEAMTTAKDKFDNLLSENDISFNKSLNTVLKLQTEETSFKKPIYIQLPDSFEDLGEVSGLRVVIDENSYVYINGEDLDALAGLKIKIERLQDKKSYEITFLGKQDEIIPQLDQTITFAFKAKDEFTTVVRVISDEEQNWGGQYEGATSSISFGTKYSGTYKVIDNNVKIRDIALLPSSQQSAIKFMVSKGYLTLENERFNPEHTFTRYEFAEALVKMFFALDTSLEASFTDVPTDSQYYPYVASGETYEIIKGFADGTFKGDTKILKEQVISLCARTIADKKGYVYPEHPEDYLKFADTDEIGKWALDDIALAVQSGLTTAGGTLNPKAEITKAESAEVLYGLFNLLYETAPGENVVEMTPTQKTYSILGTVLVLGLALWLIWKFIKKFKVILTMIACTAAIIITLIIGFKGGF